MTGPRPGLNAFRTCPAGSGTTETHPCESFPDQAHRCRYPRAPHKVHRCQCGYSWRLHTITKVGENPGLALQENRP